VIPTSPVPGAAPVFAPAVPTIAIAT